MAIASQQRVNDLADQLANLSTDEIWDLSKILVDKYSITANMLQTDLGFAEQDLSYKD